MTSKYNEEQTKLRLQRGIQMRDAVFENGIRYCRSYIKKVTGLMRWQAVHIGLFMNKEQEKELKAMQEKAMKKHADAKRIARGKQAFAYGLTFKQNQRNRPQARG